MGLLKWLWPRVRDVWGRVAIFLFRRPLLALNVRFPTYFVAAVGHLAMEADCYIKEGLLGMRPRHFEIVLAPADKVVNLHLVRYWQRYLRIITSPVLCRLLWPFTLDERLSFNMRRYVVACDQQALYPTIQRSWGERPPLLTLTDEDYERGWLCLRRWGITPGDWFVCVHCREGTFATEAVHDFRNASIENYVAAVRAIVGRGGWCIRMGDAGTRPLPPMERVVDYAHTDNKSEWMDVFLSASCRFFLGSDSGLGNVANVFGVPFGSANRGTMACLLSYGPRDVAIPKLVRSTREGRLLSFAEIYDAPAASFRFLHQFQEAGLELIENTPDEVEAVALEMLDRAAGVAAYTAEDGRLQEAFKRLLKPEHYSFGAVSRVGRDFLRKYAHLLE